MTELRNKLPSFKSLNPVSRFLWLLAAFSLLTAIFSVIILPFVLVSDDSEISLLIPLVGASCYALYKTVVGMIRVSSAVLPDNSQRRSLALRAIVFTFVLTLSSLVLAISSGNIHISSLVFPVFPNQLWDFRHGGFGIPIPLIAITILYALYAFNQEDSSEEQELTPLQSGNR